MLLMCCSFDKYTTHHRTVSFMTTEPICSSGHDQDSYSEGNRFESLAFRSSGQMNILYLKLGHAPFRTFLSISSLVFDNTHLLIILLLGNERLIWSVDHVNEIWNVSKHACVHEFAGFNPSSDTVRLFLELNCHAACSLSH
jgi:hypothetical protein